MIQNDFENAKSLIQELYSREVTEDFMTFINDIYQRIERSEKASARLCDLANLIVQEDWLALSDQLKSESFSQLCEHFGGDTYCRYEGDIFVKLYKNGSIYLGEMEQDKRSGQGKLIQIGITYYNIIIFDGTWSDDLPNGIGTQKAVILPYLREGRQIWMDREGNYTNGYADGEFFAQMYEVVGGQKEVLRSTTWKSTMGYLEPMEGYEKDEYIIAIWDTGEQQHMHLNHIEAVSGLGYSECYFYFDTEVDG